MGHRSRAGDVGVRGVTFRTDQELQEALVKWQSILHLEDWEINARLVPQEVFGDDRLQVGDCGVCTGRRGAYIRLATAETLDLSAAPGMADMERSLVHEILHCVFVSGQLWDDPANTPRYIMRHYECGIEQLARALVEMDRRDRRGAAA